MIDTKTPTTFSFQPAGRDEPVNIRTIDIETNPWFVAADVCAALDLGLKNITYHVARLDADEVRRVDRTNLGVTQKGRPMIVINESGLYALINRSDKPEAKVFQRWVNREVLPSIRKTGSYSLADHGREAMPLPMDIAEAMALAMKPVVEELASVRALLASTLEQREVAALDDLKRNQMFLARDLLKRGIGKGLSPSELGYQLTIYCRNNGYPVTVKKGRGNALDTNTYSLLAAERWQQGRS
ncbi:BRO family protein [Caulobacter segnis]|nr:BRO family protein [Caulobacter segnis]